MNGVHDFMSSEIHLFMNRRGGRKQLQPKGRRHATTFFMSSSSEDFMNS